MLAASASGVPHAYHVPLQSMNKCVATKKRLTRDKTPKANGTNGWMEGWTDRRGAIPMCQPTYAGETKSVEVVHSENF